MPIYSRYRGCFVLILLVGILNERSYGQVTGQLKDTSAGKDCPQALVSILRADSSLVKSSLSDKDGRFGFSIALPAGQYILLMMHPAYTSFFRRFDIGPLGSYDFGILPVYPKIDSLQAVIITADQVRPRFLRDTVEYNTNHIRMNVNANVEEMIGRLPGLVVDANGSITYNGQKIARVLVDGQELFGSDLTIATKNLNADMIAKIQVLDSKSRQAQFTGIDDGQRTKTLNLVLKEDSKKGYFVKTEGGGDTQGYYQLGGIMGSFNKKQQLMVLGLASNNGSTGFSGNSGGLGTGLFLEGGTQDALGASAGVGIPQAMGGAAHYANDWGVYDDHADGYYRYGHILTRPFSSSIIQQILPDSIYVQKQQSNSINSQEQQAFDSHYTYNIDSLSAFQFTLRGNSMQGRNQLFSTGSSTFNNVAVNNSSNHISSDVNSRDVYGDIMWRIRDRKKTNRIFSVVANISGQNNRTNGYLYSLNHFFQPNGDLLNVDTTDQRKAIISSGVNFNGYVNYVEPLWKNTALGISYGLNGKNTQTQQSTFSHSDGKYLQLVDSLSDDYRDIFLTQRGTVNLQGQGKIFDYVLGGSILSYNYCERNLATNSLARYHYLNFAPQVVANYNPTTFMQYSFNYGQNTKLPSITQLQPVQNNNDPLHTTLGNSNLKPSYSHSFGLNFQHGGSTIYAIGLGVGIINDDFSTKTTTDSLGRQISQVVNTSGAGNGNLSFYLNTRWKPWALDLGFHSNLTYGRSVNYVNALLSRNDSYGAGFGFQIAKYLANSYNFRITTNFSYSSTSSSINAGLKTNYWSQNHTTQLGFFPWKNWEMNTNANYTWRQKTTIFDGHNSVLLWNAFLSRNFLDNRLTARLAINDILGQNAGITRSIIANQVSQTTSNMIGRYWMLSVLYRFTKKGGK